MRRMTKGMRCIRISVSNDPLSLTLPLKGGGDSLISSSYTEF